MEEGSVASDRASNSSQDYTEREEENEDMGEMCQWLAGKAGRTTPDVVVSDSCDQHLLLLPLLKGKTSMVAQHKQVSGSVDTGEKLGRSVEVLASSGVLREFTVATEVTPLALHWTMCMAAELQPAYPDWF